MPPTLPDEFEFEFIKILNQTSAEQAKQNASVCEGGEVHQQCKRWWVAARCPVVPVPANVN